MKRIKSTSPFLELDGSAAKGLIGTDGGEEGEQGAEKKGSGIACKARRELEEKTEVRREFPAAG